MLVAIIFTLIGLVLHIWLVSTAYIYYRSKNATHLHYHEIRIQLEMFMAFKRLNSNIQKRALALYDSTFKGTFYRKHKIKAAFDQKIISNVKMERCAQFLRRHHLFKLIPEHLLVSIVDCMGEISFSTNDVILKGDHGRTQASLWLFCNIESFFDKGFYPKKAFL